MSLTHNEVSPTHNKVRRALTSRAGLRHAESGATAGERMRVIFLILLFIPLPAGLGQAAMAQDLAAGEASFKKCLPCHAVGEDARNKVGPVLNGLEGRRSGSIEGYSYSEANRKAGIVWNAESFKYYIRNPRARIPGTKMVFAGIRSENEIAALWDYLRQFGADGKKQ